MNDHLRRPRDRSDLYLAPIALAIDDRLEDLARLSDAELEKRIVIEANVDLSNDGAREAGLLTSLEHLLDLRGWSLSLHARGVQLAHEDHILVLGLPENCRRFLGLPT